MGRQSSRWQRELEYLVQMAEDDYRPSIREIAAAVGAANETVMTDLAELVRMGLVADCDLPGRLQRGKRAARAYSVTELGIAQVRGESMRLQPAAAGPPLDQPTVTGHDVDVDAEGIFRIPPGHLVIRVRGDSMAGAGIEDGSAVVIRQDVEATNGQIVLAEVQGATDDAALTLKRIYWEDGRVRLQSADVRYRPMYFPTDGVRVRGVAVETIHRRHLH
jgi:SOS-response transcriptional repressor LexA